MMYAALQRLLSLRDENRDVTTLLSAHLRRVALEIGKRAVRRNALATQEDIFMLTWNELPLILNDVKAPSDWRRVVQARLQERERDAGYDAGDLRISRIRRILGAPLQQHGRHNLASDGADILREPRNALC